MLRAMTVRSLALLLFAAACGGAHAPAAPHNGASGAGVTVEPLARTVHSADADTDVEIQVPHVTVPGNPAASAAINGALPVPTTREALDAFELGEAGLGFEVNFNRDGLLDLSIVHETMGAYPDSYVEHFLFDTATGARLTGAEVLVADTSALVAKLDATLQAAIAEARTGNTDCVTADDDPYTGDFHVTADTLKDLAITDRGAVFAYDFDFPHVIQACEPDGTMVVPLAELAPYLVPGTAVARLAR